MSRITVVQPAPVEVPRFAPVAAAWFARLLSWAEFRREARSARKSAVTRSAEAAEVRRYASEIATADPRFAADLFAAADRHERGE